MTDTERTTGTEPEPNSSPAPAPARGPSIWNRIKALLALRSVSLRDDLEVALQEEGSAETADFTQSERMILQNVLKLGEVSVEDVMVPRADIEAIEAGETLGMLVARFREAGHSRLPVYEDNLDNVVGFVHVKDALRRITEPVGVTDPEDPDSARDHPVKLVSNSLRAKVGKLDFIRSVLFVPPSMPVGDLLHEMQVKRVHMAIVIDEYGGTDGVVTIEDLLEAVVGEIEDEHDEQDRPLIRKVNSNVFLASARAELSEVKAVVGPAFEPGAHAEDVDTLGGLVFGIAGRVPTPGETVKGPNGFEFEVVAADGRHIQKLKIRRVVRKARPAGAKPKTLAKGHAKPGPERANPEAAE